MYKSNTNRMDNSQELTCQSCGMPLINAADFGTNSDNSPNKEYCAYCFQQGAFVDPDITLEQKIDQVVEAAKTNMFMPEEDARKMANEVIPTLRRWKTRN